MLYFCNVQYIKLIPFSNNRSIIDAAGVEYLLFDMVSFVCALWLGTIPIRKESPTQSREQNIMKAEL